MPAKKLRAAARREEHLQDKDRTAAGEEEDLENMPDAELDDKLSPFPLLQLPSDVQHRVAAVLFGEFTSALAAAVKASTGAAAEARASQREDTTGHRRFSVWRHRTVDMTSVFGALKTLRNAAGCCRQSRETFRAFFVAALFRGIGESCAFSFLYRHQLRLVSRFLAVPRYRHIYACIRQ